MPRPTDWQARNERAQALGYRNYYDYRVHDYGRQPPGRPVDTSIRQSTRGHAGLRELLAFIAQPRRNRIDFIAPIGQERGPDGRWKLIRVDVGIRGGRPDRHFYLRGRSISHDNLVMLRQAIAHPGALRPMEPGREQDAYRGPLPDGGQLRLPGLDYDDEEEGDEGDEFLSEDYYWDDDYEVDDYEIDFFAASSIGELAS